jgi:hypothetical protein
MYNRVQMYKNVREKKSLCCLHRKNISLREVTPSFYVDNIGVKPHTQTYIIYIFVHSLFLVFFNIREESVNHVSNAVIPNAKSGANMLAQIGPDWRLIFCARVFHLAS